MHEKVVGGRAAAAAQVVQSGCSKRAAAGSSGGIRRSCIHLQTKRQRVVRGWDCRVSPVVALEVSTTASKVGAAYMGV